MSLKHIVANLFPRTLSLEVKYIYQFFLRRINHVNKIECSHRLVTLSKKNTHVFFGYYDVSPFNHMSKEVIYNNLVEKENKIHIMLSSIGGNNEIEIAETRAWNWQQGCRLRWMPNNNREIIFNDFDGISYYARIINVDTKYEKRINAPLYDISNDGRYGLSIDFERLGIKRPGYGYVCRKYVEEEHVLEDEGIELVDLLNNEKKTILTYKQIQAISGCNTGSLSNNYLNHLCFSPSGRKFLFFWLTADNNWHKAFLLVHNLDTCETILLEGKEKASHYVWLDDNNIICTTADEHQNWHYYNYNIMSQKKTILNPCVLNIDGHPSVFTEDRILTDTYPNLMGFQRIYFANVDDGGYDNILEIYSNCKIEGEKRTDLHPRLNGDKTIISFDSNQDKYRTLNFLYLNE